MCVERGEKETDSRVSQQVPISEEVKGVGNDALATTQFSPRLNKMNRGSHNIWEASISSLNGPSRAGNHTRHRLTPSKSSPLLLRPLSLLPVLVGIGLPLRQLGLERPADLGRGRRGRCRLRGDDVAQLLRYVEDPG